MQPDNTQVIQMPIYSVEPNRNQPRKHFDEESLNHLAASIQKYGVLEPIIVRKEDNYYSIIAGERRWRASMKAKKKTIPVIIKDSSKQEAAEIALIENIHREDLNPIEEAKAYQTYCEQFHVSQTEMAEILSKDRTSIAHSIRLLHLPESVQEMVVNGRISVGHAKDLLSLSDESLIAKAAEEIANAGLSVKAAKKVIAKYKSGKMSKKKSITVSKDANLERLASQLSGCVGTKIAINGSNEKGSIVIDYYSMDDLERLYEYLLQYSE